MEATSPEPRAPLDRAACTHLNVTAFGLDEQAAAALFDRVAEAAHRLGEELAVGHADCDCERGSAPAFPATSKPDPPAPLEMYRRAHTLVGMPWPGDEEVRRLYPVSDEPAAADAPASVVQLRWPHRAAEPPAAQRFADAFGWDHVPELTPEERQEADRELAEAQAQARRYYGLNPQTSTSELLRAMLRRRLALNDRFHKPPSDRAGPL